MRKTALNLMMAVIAAALGLAQVAHAQSAMPQRDLLAHGDDEGLWVAIVQTVHDRHLINEQTLLMHRGFGGGWSVLMPISTRVVSVASSGGELLAALDDGRWMIINPLDMRVGTLPPGGSHMLAIASNRNEVWAIIRALPPKAATRRLLLPSTERLDEASLPAAGTMPSTQTSSPAESWRTYAFYLDKGQWIDAVEMPQAVPADPAKISLAVVNQSPIIAWRDSDNMLNVCRLSPDRTWTAPIRISLGNASADFKLLTIRDKPALWMQSVPAAAGSPTTVPSTDAGRLFSNDDLSQSILLQLSGPQAAVSQTVTVAFGHLRWLAISGDKPPIEQTFEMDGKPVGVVAAIATPKPQEIPLRTCILIGIGVIVAAIAAGIRTRLTRTPPAFVGAEQVEEYLAPPGVRFAAGLIDLLPCLAALTLVHPILDNQLTAAVDPDAIRNLTWIAIAAYVVHTMAAELICGQSVGKMIFGLYVVRRDGNPPTAWAIVLRNMLRVADVCIFFLPLSVILFTPLRQRLGDLAAGTVVVGENPESEEEADE